MFDTVTNWFTDLLSSLGPVGGAILLIAALVFGIGAAIKGMKALNNQQIGQGITFIVIAIAIAIIAVATLGGIMGMGKKAGEDLNTGDSFVETQAVQMLAVASAYALHYKHKMLNRKAA